jgi:hypothetical protein
MPGSSADAVGTFDLDLATGQMTWSQLLYDLHGLVPEVDEPSRAVLFDAMVAEDRERAHVEFHRGAQAGGLFSVRYQMVDRQGHTHELVMAAEAWGMEGDASYVSGFVLDVTRPLEDHMNQAVAASAQHRAVIEQAKGVVMLALRVPEDAAFRALRGLSNTHNIRLADLAEQLTDHVSTGSPTDGTPAEVFLRFMDSLEGSQPGSRTDQAPLSGPVLTAVPAGAGVTAKTKAATAKRTATTKAR